MSTLPPAGTGADSAAAPPPGPGPGWSPDCDLYVDAEDPERILQGGAGKVRALRRPGEF